MNPEYVEKYKNLYRNHWWWQSREIAISELLRSLELPREARILDIGCGDGFFFPILDTFGDTVGVEFDPKIISPDSLYLDRIICGDILDLKLEANSFDLILALDVIEHIQDDQAVIDKICELVKPGGIAIISVPAFSFLWTSHDNINDHKRRYNRRELLSKIRIAGMNSVSSGYLFVSLIVLKLAQRMLETAWMRLGFDMRLKSEQIPPSYLNLIAKTYFVIEHNINKSLRIPFGTSLFVVGRKPLTSGI